MRRVQIRKVATLGTGHTPSRSVPEYWVPEECTIPWLTLADVWQVRDGTKTVVTETKEKISPAGVANSSAVVHPAGTVAFSRTASVGFSCILGTDMATSQDWVTWTCGPHLDPEYLLWVLRGERDQILGRTQGSTHKTIYMPDIEELTIPLPPIEEQRRIARRVEKSVAETHELISLKASTLDAVVRRLASARSELITSDLHAPLRRFTRRLTSGPRGWAGYVTEAGAPFLRITNVSRGDLAISNRDLLRVAPPEGPEAERTRVVPGDIVVTITADIGSVGLVPDELGGAYVSQHLALLSLDHSVEPAWVANALLTAGCQSQLVASQYGGTKTQLSLEDIANVRIPVLDAKERDRRLIELGRQADLTMALVESLDRQIQLLREKGTALIAEEAVGPLVAA